ncbi:hypothetical protein EW445_17780 [Salmonella enterica subsp. enterica serovar Newport]|nr:hypothetical protein [Salmonella enterica]ECD2400799.1 hypothetical protein [Salmonella enterica subsp. enterica serovar Newport]
MMTILNPDDDLMQKISLGDRLFELMSNQIYIFSDVTLPAGTVIRGNNATIKAGAKNKPVFNIHTNNIHIQGCNFVGQDTPINNEAYNKNHFAIKIAAGVNVRITQNSFTNFSGGGVGLIGLESDEYMYYSALITENLFQLCYIAVLWTGRYEFGRFINNRIYRCRVGIWDEAGNWSVNSNKITACRNPYISTNKAIDFAANNIKAFSANSAHGTFVGNECNHANDIGSTIWTINADIPLISGESYKPGNSGIIFDGVLPPTVTGLTLYYCNVTMRNRPQMEHASKLVGVVASTMNFSADKAGIMEVVALTAHTKVMLRNVKAT